MTWRERKWVQNDLEMQIWIFHIVCYVKEEYIRHICDIYHMYSLMHSIKLIKQGGH